MYEMIESKENEISKMSGEYSLLSHALVLTGYIDCLCEQLERWAEAKVDSSSSDNSRVTSEFIEEVRLLVEQNASSSPSGKAVFPGDHQDQIHDLDPVYRPIEAGQ